MPQNLIRIGEKIHDADTGAELDPLEIAKQCVDVIGIVQRLNAAVMGTAHDILTPVQLQAAKTLLDRIWPEPKTLEVTGSVTHRVIPEHITAEEAKRTYMELMRLN